MVEASTLIDYIVLFREGVKNTQRGGAHKSRDLRSPICDPPKIAAYQMYPP